MNNILSYKEFSKNLQMNEIIDPLSIGGAIFLVSTLGLFSLQLHFVNRMFSNISLAVDVENIDSELDLDKLNSGAGILKFNKYLDKSENKRLHFLVKKVMKDKRIKDESKNIFDNLENKKSVRGDAEFDAAVVRFQKFIKKELPNILNKDEFDELQTLLQKIKENIK